MKTGDNETAKKNYYGLIKNKFRELQSGKISWSDIIREDLQFIDTEKKCIYCGSTENITKDHIIPKSKGGRDNLENLQVMCFDCNFKKSNALIFKGV